MTHSNLVSVFNGQIANQSTQLCNARDLHTFLEVNMRFAEWIGNRISEYGFIENEDYIIITERTAGRPRKEYHITLDMGKELGMVEKNEKGRQIRKYFIKVENLQKSSQIIPLVSDFQPIDQSDEALALFIKMYSHCLQAHQMQQKLKGTSIPIQMESAIGGQYLYNFEHPLSYTLTEAKAFIQKNAERLPLVRAVHSLLN